MRLSIIIVSWNTRDLLARCLESVQREGGGDRGAGAIETFVVDNASSDGSAEMVAGRFPSVRLIANRENVGFARANNQALAQANTGLQGKSLARVDRAFLTVFQSFVDDDPAQRRDALQEFAGLYTRSDWGRYKPWTQPVFLYGLVSLARWFCPSFDWSAEAAPLFDATWRALWTSYEARRGEFDARADAFDGDLAFLRCEP